MSKKECARTYYASGFLPRTKLRATELGNSAGVFPTLLVVFGRPGGNTPHAACWNDPRQPLGAW